MKRLLVSMLITGLLTAGAQAQYIAGLISAESVHDVRTTTDRLVAAVQDRGLTVFNRIDHAAGAHKVGKELTPAELVIFGNPEVGTSLMGCGQSIAIDLPLKALVWQDADGTVRVTSNDPAWLADRHALGGCEAVIGKVRGALSGIMEEASR